MKLSKLLDFHNYVHITCHLKMDEKSDSNVEDNEFSTFELKNHPPVSDIRSFLFNSLYPSDMALHYLLLNNQVHSVLNQSIFFGILKDNPEIFENTKSFDAEWISKFVETTMNFSEKQLSLLKSIYFYFFELIASNEHKELNDNLDLFLKLTTNPKYQITELYHCRIISIIILENLQIKFDPAEIHKISEFDTRNLHKILNGHYEKLPNYSSISLIYFAIIYCVPSAIIDHEITNYDQKKEIPNLIQIIPEPEFIFYHCKYFEDDIFDFAIFLFQAIYGFVQNEIDSFNEEQMEDDDNNNFGIVNDDDTDLIFVNNPQLKIKSLLDLFLNNSIVTGTFLRVILMFNKNQDQNVSILSKITKILFECPKIRLSIILRCQHLLSFFELYSEYQKTVFNPENGEFFINIPIELSKFSVYKALSPYWNPQDSIIQIYDSNNPSLLIPHAIAMINRCRIEPSSFILKLSKISMVQISGTLTQIFDNLVLCDNFSSKQTEEILFMGISSFFQMSRKISIYIHKNKFLHHILVVTTFKSLKFIFKTPQFHIVTEYGLLQKHSYKVIRNFIRENIDLFKEYVDTYNNIDNFYQRASIIQNLSPRLKSVMLYFQIFLRSTSYQQFWIALKFMKSLTYLVEDVENLENITFELKDPILIKNAILFITELTLKKEGFGDILIQSENFPNFITQITKSFEEPEYGEASLFLLFALYKRNLVKPEHKIKIQYIQFFFDNILNLHEILYQILLDLSSMICLCNKLKRFPFKIKHQKQAFNDRPYSISKSNFLVFLYINYPEIAARCSKPPTDFDIKIEIQKTFSFMSIINRPYYYLVTPIFFDGIEIENAEENFALVKNKGSNPSFLNQKSSDDDND